MITGDDDYDDDDYDDDDNDDIDLDLGDDYKITLVSFGEEDESFHHTGTSRNLVKCSN